MKRSIQILLFIAIFSIPFFACDNNDVEQICETDNPLEDIEWLENMKNYFVSSQSKDRIIQYNYKNEIVFSIEDCYDCADAMKIIYNCEEEILCQFGGIAGFNTCPDFDSLATNSAILYQD